MHNRELPQRKHPVVRAGSIVERGQTTQDFSQAPNFVGVHCAIVYSIIIVYNIILYHIMLYKIILYQIMWSIIYDIKSYVYIESYGEL